MTEVDIEERLMRSLGNPYPMDARISRHDLERDGDYPFRMMLGAFPIYMLTKAKETADEFAASYRGFHVGVVGSCFSSSNNEVGLFGGANVKVDDTDLVNIHAEDVLLDKMRRHDYDILSALAVVGPTQNDTQSGQPMHTLHPCGKCRGKFDASPVVGRQTMFFCSNSDFSVVELAGLSDLNAYHQNDDDSGISRFELGEDFEGWDEQVTPAMLERFFGQLTIKAVRR